MTTRSAFTFSFVDRYAALIIHAASAMVIARLLTPGEIGVYSLTMVLVGFIATFRDFGAGQFIVQASELTATRIGAAWTVQLGLGLLLGAMIAAGSIPVARFYAEPQMTDIMLLLAASFVMTPFQALPTAWLIREMRFGALAAIRFGCALAYAALAIALTWAGWGPVSLAWANLASTVAGIALATMLRDSRLPWIPRFSGIRQVMSFGSHITAISLLSEIRTASPEVFLGKLQGMTDTGLFGRGQGLVAMFDRLVMDAVNPVAYTLFAKRAREGKDAASVFVDASALITAFGWSFLGCLGILAFPAIRVLYGTQWDAAVDPTRWMSAAMAIAVPANVCMAPIVASGALDKVLRVAIISTSMNVVLVGIGAHLGLLSLTQMMVPAAAISGSLWLWLAWHRIGFRWTGLFRVYAKSAAVAVGAMSIPLAVTLWMGWRSEDILTLLLVAVPGAAGGFVIAAYLTRHAVWGELVRAIKPLPS